MRYPKELDQFVRDNAWHRTDEELARMAREKFNIEITEYLMSCYRKNRRIHNGLKSGLNRNHPRKYSLEMIEYIRSVAKGKSRREIAKIIKDKFDMDVTDAQVKTLISNYHIVTGLDGRFKKGHVPANKGKHQPISGRMSETWFRKGQKSINSVPIGTVKERDDGYVWIKVQELHGRWNWMQLHKYIYELAHGDVPKGMLITFKDGNSRNFAIDNLVMLSMEQNVRMNKHKIRDIETEGSFETALNLANLEIAISKRKKELRRGN